MTVRRVLHGCAGLAALAGVEWSLYVTGGGVLTGPRLGEPGSWAAWLVSRPPDLALMALLRLLGLALGAYLLVVFALGLSVRLLRLQPMIAGVDRITPTSLREFLDRVTGVAAAGAVAMASLAATAGPVAAAPGSPQAPTGVHAPPSTFSGPPVTLRGLAGPQPDPTPTTTTTVKPPPALSPPATLPPERQRITPRDLRDLPPSPGEPSPSTDTTVALEAEAEDGAPAPDIAPGSSESLESLDQLPMADPSPLPPERRRITSDRAADESVIDDHAPPRVGTDEAATDVSAEADGAAAPGEGTMGRATTGPGPQVPADPTQATWEVEVGDHFWSIAHRTLANGWGRQPSPSEVDPYWRELIQRNRTRLVDPANADLLLPGQVLVLPPVPLSPAA